MKKKLRHIIVDSIREIIFGLEDSLVSTLGAVTGIAAGTQNTQIVILSGLVLIAAESMSMAAGSYLSSKHAIAAEQFERKQEGKPKEEPHEKPFRSGWVMGVFYFVGGFIPLFPYFILPTQSALLPSVILTGGTLYGLGVWSAKYSNRSKVKSGIEMAGISLAAALVGFIIGHVIGILFGLNV